MAGMKQLPKLAEAIALFFKQTPEQRMATAQQRAALPKDQGGLGLPADNTATQRADAMFPKTVYRGMTEPHLSVYPGISEHVRPDRGGSKPTFVTPSKDLARTYGQHVYPLRMNESGIPTMDFDGRYYTGTRFDPDELSTIPNDIFNLLEGTDYVDSPEEMGILMRSAERLGISPEDAVNKQFEFTDFADDLDLIGADGKLAKTYSKTGTGDISFDVLNHGFDGVHFRNILDVGPEGQTGPLRTELRDVIETPQSVYAVTNNRLRSPDAVFDPVLRDWTHMFGSAAATGILLDQIPYDEEKQGALYAQ